MNYTKSISEGVLRLNFTGDLIGEARGDELYEVVHKAIEDGILYCAIDITDVRYINSSGIGVLITLLTKFRNKGGEVVLIKPSEHVQKLLVITKLTNIFKVVQNASEADEALKIK
jgi:anti-sigma B factor antagonist